SCPAATSGAGLCGRTCARFVQLSCHRIRGSGGRWAMTDAAVELRDVSVRYGKRTALDALSATVASGEWLGLIGPNGAGKSSLLRAIVGIVSHAGTIAVGGAPLDRVSSRERAQLVAYVPQEPELPPDMSAFEYVLLGRSPYVGYFAIESSHD